MAQPPVLLVLGDSLSAGYGISTEQGWVALLERRIAQQGLPHRVVNASISGDTTAGGLARLPALLKQHRPAVLVLELGANDGLRGLPLRVIRANLNKLIRLGRDSGSQVLLVGVRLPPNYGVAYTRGFQAAFQEAGADADVPLVPALLKDVGENLELMQSDGLHPTAAAQERMLDTVWPTLEPLLAASTAGFSE